MGTGALRVGSWHNSGMGAFQRTQDEQNILPLAAQICLLGTDREDPDRRSNRTSQYTVRSKSSSPRGSS